MPLCRHIIFWIFLFLYCSSATATTFTVSSNADSGPGSLRDAIDQANANGSSTQDLIIFNIADQSVAGRTINLLSELPALSSNLVVDGTTQGGTAFGISNAKVELFLPAYPASGYFTCLLVENATNVEIYGLVLSSAIDPYQGEFYGIRVKSSSNVIIGGKGKGNVIYGWFWDITNSYYNYYVDYSNTVSIKGNMVGVREDGSQAGSPIAVLFKDTYNLEVGGADPAEGNQMEAAYNCLDANHKDPSITGSFFAKVINNKFNVDPTGNIAYGGGIDAAVKLNGSNIPTTDTEVVKTLVSNNVIATSDAHIQLLIESTNHLVKVTGNKIGANITGSNQIGSADVGIFLLGCYKVLVGGDNPDDKNYIAGSQWGVYAASPKVLITKNSFFCNQQGIYIDSWSYTNPMPFIHITTYSATQIAGISNPLARIELFQNHDCTNGYCQGKTYITTLYADNNGKWSYAGAQTPSMIATATTVDSATSEFPVPRIDNTKVQVTQATCGKSNGSVTGMQILDGSDFHWVDQNGHTVGTDTNLVNMPEGTYTLRVSFGPNGCTVFSNNFTINNIQPPAAISTYLYNTTCGERNGQIIVNGFLSDYVARWVNTLGDTLAFPPYSSYFNAGTYSLVLYPPGDNSCLKTYGPYTLTNLGGATVNINPAVITPASCHLANGSIKALQFNNVTGISHYRWVDAGDVTMGYSADLLNVPAGQYRLKFKDDGPCDTVVTDIFTVGSVGLVQMDSSSRMIGPSKCSVNSGSIQNVKVQNGLSYQWIDTVTMTVAGTAADLTNAPPGYYKLIATNNSGCTDSTGVYHVPLTAIFPLSATYEVHPETCNRGNGTLSISQLSADPADYSFRWILTSTGQLVGTGTGITNLAAASYSLYAEDENGCDQLVGMPSLNEISAPVISGAKLTPDVCLQKNGSISPEIKGAPPFSYAWYNANGQLQSNDPQLNNHAAGDYSVVVTDANNCSTTSSYRIADSSITIDAPGYPDLLILKGDNAVLDPIDLSPGLYLLYSAMNTQNSDQQNNTGNFTIGPLYADTSVYVVLSTGACTSPLTPVHIKVVQTLTIVMPNVFTPNNDGHNDIFRVKYPEAIKTFHMKVFNRWGQMVFTSEDPYRGWNGTFKGLDQPTGTYVWMINYQDFLGNSKSLSGTVILLR